MPAAIIIGASRGLGKALAYTLAAKGINSLLVARDEKQLQTIAEDIATKYGLSPKVRSLDISDQDVTRAREFAASCCTMQPETDRVYITAAMVSEQDQGPGSADALKTIHSTNYTGAALLVTAFCEQLQDSDAVVAVMSSVAAIRPRGKNISYAASKIALEYHVLGLRHFFANKPVRLQVYRIGYMDTAMAAGINPPLFKKENPAIVARHIAAKFRSPGGLYYYPRYWRLVAVALKCVPWFIYKKLKF